MIFYDLHRCLSMTPAWHCDFYGSIRFKSSNSIKYYCDFYEPIRCVYIQISVEGRLIICSVPERPGTELAEQDLRGRGSGGTSQGLYILYIEIYRERDGGRAGKMEQKPVSTYWCKCKQQASSCIVLSNISASSKPGQWSNWMYNAVVHTSNEKTKFNGGTGCLKPSMVTNKSSKPPSPWVLAMLHPMGMRCCTGLWVHAC